MFEHSTSRGAKRRHPRFFLRSSNRRSTTGLLYKFLSAQSLGAILTAPDLGRRHVDFATSWLFCLSAARSMRRRLSFRILPALPLTADSRDSVAKLFFDKGVNCMITKKEIPKKCDFF